MSEGAETDIRRSVLGADRVFSVVSGGKDGGGRTEPATRRARGSDDNPCPVTPLGDAAGIYHFLDTGGQKRELSAHQLGTRNHVLSLFRGNEEWLRSAFPVKKQTKDVDGNVTEYVADFHVNKAAAFLMKTCSDEGMFGEQIVLRRPGVWGGEGGLPVVHCGDGVLIEGRWYHPGARTAGYIWGLAPAAPRPGEPCGPEVAAQLQQDLQTYWAFSEAGGAVVMIGLIANGYYGAAPNWRPNGFVTGSSGSGKTMLLNTVRAALPQHYYTNDVTKAGLEQAIDGRAMPSIIDEASDRRNQDAARDLVDLVLSASGGEGTKGHRGTVDGKGRKVEVVGSIIMFTINPPELQPQHLSRFTLL